MKNFCIFIAICAAAACFGQAQPPAAAHGASAPQTPEQPQSPDDEMLQKLYARNPFGDPSAALNAQAQPTAAAPNGLELRSIYCVDKKWHFGIYDSAQKKSYTLKLGGTYSEQTPYAVEFFDDETNSISISTPIGSYTLTLKERDQLTAAAVSTTGAGAANGAKQKTATAKAAVQNKLIKTRQQPARK